MTGDHSSPSASARSNRMIMRIVGRLLGRSPAHVVPHPEPAFMARNKRYSAYRVGDWSYGFPNIYSYPGDARLTIGRFCSIALDVTILLGGEHRTDWVTTYPFSFLFEEARQFSGHPRTKGDVVIGHDVWIGHGGYVLSGVSIGNGAAVGAGSVVARDVEPYAIVAGNPAQRIRFRFPAATIEALQRIAWWDWPLATIKAAWPLLMSDDVESFIARYG